MGDLDAARAVWREALDIFTDLDLDDAAAVRAKSAASSRTAEPATAGRG